MRVAKSDEHEGFDHPLSERHYLGLRQPLGDYLKQVVKRGGQAVARLMWGPASYAHQKPRSRNGQESDHAGGAPRLERAEQAIPAAHPNDAELNLDAQVLGWVLRELAGLWHTECG